MVVVGFGWAKPVPVNMNNFSKPKRYMALTALAGPVMNLLIAFVALFVFGLIALPLGGLSAVGAAGVAINMVYRTAILSIALAVFNMLPIPPLDGSKVVFSVISDAAYMKLMRYERYGMVLLIILMVMGVFDKTLWVAVEFLLDKFLIATRAGMWFVRLVG
jgi:Zn-dependent protease